MSDAVYDAFLGAGNNIRQVVRSSFAPNGNVIPAYQSGAVNPSEFYGGNARQEFNFESTDLAGILGALSLTSGLFLSSDAITLPYNRRANGGTFEGASSHFALSATDGFAFVQSISGSQDNPGVSANVSFLPQSSDGFTNPISTAKNTTLTAAAFNTAYDFGPVYFGGVQVPQAVGWTVDPGMTIRARAFDGSLFPTRHYVVRVLPSITVVFEELDDVNDVFSDLFAAMTTAAVYARQLVDGATHLSDATAGHVKLSFATGITNVEQIAVDEGSSAQVALRLYGKTLSSSVASAIP